MHIHQLSNWQHPHNFAKINRRGETRTKWVLLLTFTTMLVEIAAGIQFRSMALLADGWHMATHVLAFIITLYAYRYSRIHEQDQTFAFSPAKVSILGGFASSIALAMVALMMIAESAMRLVKPEEINFDDATLVACIGLGINLLCAFLLSDHHDHAHEAVKQHNHHEHEHEHEHEHHPHSTGKHQDHNLRAAFMHVLADALTSVLAITALLAGKYYGWNWLDAIMGFVGAVIILIWAWGLIRDTSPALLDQSVDQDFIQSIQNTVEADDDCRVTDLHVWRLGATHQAAIVVIVTQQPKPPNYYKAKLANFVHLDHITVEVNVCVGEACLAE
ncbi:CDF family Co(II)/Ni(II) efflux transporter DmeF [Methylomonas sp. AM2-LC]|uniref:CDF family Co(II)/Ni(II) efflux transporter DmeF n=1 Tax=Methylomonas sp. AM2-LC TaxID=3153301 RepID=UPI0032647675